MNTWDQLWSVWIHLEKLSPEYFWCNFCRTFHHVRACLATRLWSLPACSSAPIYLYVLYGINQLAFNCLILLTQEFYFLLNIFLSTPCDSRSLKAHQVVFDNFFVDYTWAGVEPRLLRNRIPALYHLTTPWLPKAKALLYSYDLLAFSLEKCFVFFAFTNILIPSFLFGKLFSLQVICFELGF